MRLKSLKKSSGMTALAVGLAALAVPSVASADPGDHERGGGRGSNWNHRDEGRGGGGEGRGGGWQGQQQAQAQVQGQPQVQVQQRSEGPHNWGGDRNGGEPGRGWGGGQRFGRDWSNGGAVNRPEPAFRNQAPQVQVQQAPRAEAVPQQQQWQANRSYSARGDADRAYAPRTQGWDGQRWSGQTSGQNWDRDRTDRRWDGNRVETRRWDGGNREVRRWDGDRSGGWNRDWRRDNRYNWQSYRSGHREIYNLGRYRSPYNNWSYRRLGIGFYLQPLFFSQSYWIDDPWMYRLPEAYGPYRWVRYYDDALLVDVYSGEVVDVLYDVFW
jgi:hypothetical protein